MLRVFERICEESSFGWPRKRARHVCRFYLPHWIPSESETQCSWRRKRGKNWRRGDEQTGDRRSWNKKGNCVIYSTEQGANISSVCMHRWIHPREGWRQRSYRQRKLLKIASTAACNRSIPSRQFTFSTRKSFMRERYVSFVHLCNCIESSLRSKSIKVIKFDQCQSVLLHCR